MLTTSFRRALRIDAKSCALGLAIICLGLSADADRLANAQAPRAASPRANAQAQRLPQRAPQAPNPPNQPAANKASTAQPQQQSCNLTSSHKSGACDVVEVSLEASGEILQTNQEGKTERAPMEVVAGFKYEERFENYSADGGLRSVRRYEQAGMKRKFGATITRPLLDSSRKYVVSEFNGKKTRIYSTGGPMKDAQYALLHELPFNTTLLDRLLPNRVVKLGEDWTLSNEVVTALLGVDAIENNTIHLSLTSVSDNFAEVELYQLGAKNDKGEEGPSTLSCASEGATVELDMEGKFQFDLKSRRITWFGVRISERRSQSVATPGLEWSATLKISIAPLEEPEKLIDEVVAPFKGAPKPELLMLYYNAQKGPWKFQHSRKWKMIEDGDKITSLCYLDGGEAVAQCNVLSNGKIDLATKPSLAGYKEEIKKGLGDRFAKFAEEAAYEGPNGADVYYVVADGLYEDAPYRWVYYLITDKDGNQATIMFELRADLLEKYDDSGNDIVETFRLVPRSTTGLREALQAPKDAKDAKTTPQTQPNATK